LTKEARFRIAGKLALFEIKLPFITFQPAAFDAQQLAMDLAPLAGRVLLAVSPSASKAIRELSPDGSTQYKAYDVPAAQFLREVSIAQLDELAGIRTSKCPTRNTSM
jgi:hypothetical protein